MTSSPDDWVYTTAARMLVRNGLSSRHVTIHAGSRVKRKFAEANDIPYRETPPPGHPDHPHNAPRPDDGTS